MLPVPGHWNRDPGTCHRRPREPRPRAGGALHQATAGAGARTTGAACSFGVQCDRIAGSRTTGAACSLQCDRIGSSPDGRTSVDRGTVAALSTNSTPGVLVRLSRICRTRGHLKQINPEPLHCDGRGLMACGAFQAPIQTPMRSLTLCASRDSDLEAFSRNPSEGSFTILIFLLTVFTRCLNKLFLSY